MAFRPTTGASPGRPGHHLRHAARQRHLAGAGRHRAGARSLHGPAAPWANGRSVTLVVPPVRKPEETTGKCGFFMGFIADLYQFGANNFNFTMVD